MCRRIRRGIGTWLGVAALLCQVFLPLGLAQLADAQGLGSLAQAAQSEHYHDPDLANSLGPDWVCGHSHAGGAPSARVRFDLAHLTPFTVMDPPESPAVVMHWAAFDADPMAPAPAAADSFSRPQPRAPPLPA